MIDFKWSKYTFISLLLTYLALFGRYLCLCGAQSVHTASSLLSSSFGHFWLQENQHGVDQNIDAEASKRVQNRWVTSVMVI